eukprot:990360-Rhodomonas_salina.3
MGIRVACPLALQCHGPGDAAFKCTLRFKSGHAHPDLMRRVRAAPASEDTRRLLACAPPTPCSASAPPSLPRVALAQAARARVRLAHHSHHALPLDLSRARAPARARVGAGAPRRSGGSARAADRALVTRDLPPQSVAPTALPAYPRTHTHAPRHGCFRAA